MYEQHSFTGQLGIEFKTMQAMVDIYCRAHHTNRSNVFPCSACTNFLNYANEKLDRCPYGQHKPTCNICPIHCYKNEQRLHAKIIMRYAGPRMLLKHPILAIKHLLAEKHPVPSKIPHQASNRHARKNKTECNTNHCK